MIGENPLFLARLNVGPALYGLYRRITAVLVVAKHAAQQSVVGRGNIVVVVELYRCKSRHIYAVLFVLGYLSRQRGVKAVRTLDYKHHLRLELQLVSAELAFARLEIVTWELNLFACKNLCQLLVEKVEIDGVQRLKIVVTILFSGSLCAVQEIVVERDCHGT